MSPDTAPIEGFPAPDAPGAPTAIPVPDLATDAPSGPIEGLAGSQEAPEPFQVTPPPGPAADAPRRRGRPPKGTPPLSDDDRKAARRRRYLREKGGQDAPAAGQGSNQAPATDGSPTPAEVAQWGATFALGFSFLARAVAGKRGKHWQLADDEAAQLGQAWATAAAPWLGGLGQASPFVSAAIVTLAIVAPRVLADAEAVAALPPEVPPIVPPAAAAPPADAPLTGGGPILPHPNFPAPE